VTAADVLRPLVDATLGSDAAVRVRCWDGSAYGPPDAPVHVVFRSRRALRRLLWAPNELGFARAYVSGDVDLEGDVFPGLAEIDRLADPETGPGIVVDGRTKAALLAAALRLGVLGPPPRPPAEEVRLAGRRHTRRRDRAAVRHHYDVGNEFYELVLGPSLTYSCAYFADLPTEGPDEPALEAAQRAKCDLVARKLALREGMRVLDVGCGWGTFALHAARTYGVRAVGVTLSREQAARARERAAQAGVGDRVEFRVQDYRDVLDGPFDAIASIGMAEHVGRSGLPDYAGHLYSLLAPRGRLLNHAIARRPGPPDEPSRTSFIERYVFPDGELEPLGVMVGALEDAGFEVRDVESLREHYGLTLRAWVANLEARWEEAVALSSPGRARVWRLYMAGSALAFEANRLGVNQVLAVRPGPRGASGMPRSRRELLGS
jgi:cyclopropane-fatty-acyl-phospholipid synthase